MTHGINLRKRCWQIFRAILLQWLFCVKIFDRESFANPINNNLLPNKTQQNTLKRFKIIIYFVKIPSGQNNVLFLKNDALLKKFQIQTC